jgi:MFS family permease
MGGQTPGRGRTALIYLLPALMDMVLALVLFVGTVRAAKMEGAATRVAFVLAVWSMIYIVACPLVGRLVTPRNAHRLVLAGCMLLALASGLLAAATGFVAMLILVGVVALSAALFFPPFQIFMKDVDSANGRSVAYSTGLYTFAWSTGFACGPLVSGFLMQNDFRGAGGGKETGWRIAFLFGAAVCLAMSAVLVALLRSRGRTSDRHLGAPENEQTPTAVLPYASMPDLAWLGWIGAGAGFIALSVIRSVFPARAVNELKLPAGTLGVIFFGLSMTQALMGLALTRSRFWMYRPGPVAAFGAAGLLGILCFGLGGTPAVFLIAAVLFGIYSGAFCFYMVFHALVHPNRASHYVAVNETMVGLTGFLAPLAGGAMADAWGFRFPYLVLAGITLVATAIQIWVHRSKPVQAKP